MEKKFPYKSVLVVSLLLTLAGMSGCAQAGAEGGGWISSFIPLLIMLALVFGMFYFLMIRPMRQREKKHDEMVEGLDKGDTVITAGGMYGRIETVDENSVVLRVESGALIRVTKGGLLNRPEGDTMG